MTQGGASEEEKEGRGPVYLAHSTSGRERERDGKIEKQEKGKE